MENFATAIAKTLFLLLFFFSKKLTNLINYSFWMTTMSSFRLKTYFNGSFQLLETILTNIWRCFFNIYVWCGVQSNINKRKPHTNKFTAISRWKMFPDFRFFSNETTKEINSVSVRKHRQNTPHFTKQWMNERFTKLVPVLPSWKYLETNGAAWTWGIGS